MKSAECKLRASLDIDCLGFDFVNSAKGEAPKGRDTSNKGPLTGGVVGRVLHAPPTIPTPAPSPSERLLFELHSALRGSLSNAAARTALGSWREREEGEEEGKDRVTQSTT